MTDLKKKCMDFVLEYPDDCVIVTRHPDHYGKYAVFAKSSDTLLDSHEFLKEVMRSSGEEFI